MCSTAADTDGVTGGKKELQVVPPAFTNCALGELLCSVQYYVEETPHLMHLASGVASKACSWWPWSLQK